MFEIGSDIIWRKKHKRHCDEIFSVTEITVVSPRKNESVNNYHVRPNGKLSFNSKISPLATVVCHFFSWLSNAHRTIDWQLTSIVCWITLNWTIHVHLQTRTLQVMRNLCATLRGLHFNIKWNVYRISVSEQPNHTTCLNATNITEQEVTKKKTKKNKQLANTLIFNKKQNLSKQSCWHTATA